MTETIASGGDQPDSITVHGGLVYVLNSGGAGNITGFTVSADGDLAPIAGSTRPLSGAATNPAEISFSPDGSFLVVSERNTDAFSVYAVQANGTATAPGTEPSAGETPFGFAFDKRGRLIASEAVNNEAGQSSASSYNFVDGELDVITASEATFGTAACWVAITRNGRYAYVTNPGTDSVTGFAVGRDGTLTPLNADGVTATTHIPVDEVVNGTSRYLHVLNLGNSGPRRPDRVQHQCRRQSHRI